MRGSNGGYLKLIAGGEGRVAAIQWIDDRSGIVTTQIAGGTVDGLVLTEANIRGDRWTEFCINEETAELC